MIMGARKGSGTTPNKGKCDEGRGWYRDTQNNNGEITKTTMCKRTVWVPWGWENRKRGMEKKPQPGHEGKKGGGKMKDNASWVEKTIKNSGDEDGATSGRVCLSGK